MLDGLLEGLLEGVHLVRPRSQGAFFRDPISDQTTFDHTGFCLQFVGQTADHSSVTPLGSEHAIRLAITVRSDRDHSISWNRSCKRRSQAISDQSPSITPITVRSAINPELRLGIIPALDGRRHCRGRAA